MKADPGICRIRFLCAIVLVLFASAAAEDVLLLLPKNFDVRAHKGWSWNKHDGRKEFTASQSAQTLLRFRGNQVTAGGVETTRYPIDDDDGGGVVLHKSKTEIVATYDRGHLAGTYYYQARNWNQGRAYVNDAEDMQVYYRGTVTGEAGSDGILKIKVQITEETILDREMTFQKFGEGEAAKTKTIRGGGWKKRNQEPNLFSWGAEFKLPVGELQSSQVLSGQNEDDGEPEDGESGQDAGAVDDAALAEGGDPALEGKTGDEGAAATTEQEAPEFTPAELAAASSLAGGAALVGSLLLLGMSGVEREELVQAIRDLLRGSRPVDSFGEWKQKYGALGWKYSEAGGVATFDPVDGCRNVDGLVWSSRLGTFVDPHAVAGPAPSGDFPRDGDVDESGEVWSSLSGGYVDRKTFDRDMASRAAIAEAGRLRYDDNPYVREARSDFLKAKQDHLDAEVKLAEKSAALLALNMEQLQGKEAGSRFYTRQRDEFLRTTVKKAKEALAGQDLEKMAADLDAINEMIERQGRPTFEPQKTTRDRIEDGVMRTTALVADMALTKGGASALVSGFQTARDGILGGMDEEEALARGSLQGAVEAATAGVGHLAGKLGMNQAIVQAGTDAAIGAATSFRDQVAQGKDILSAAARALSDGAFAGGTSYVTDKVSDIGLAHAQPYLDKMKARFQVADVVPPAPQGGIPAEVAGKLDAARGNITGGRNGENVLPIEDAKALMRDSRTGRVMKHDPGGFAEVTEAHANTVKQIKANHDAATVADFEHSHPISDAQKVQGAVRRECKVEDFSTPGKETKMSVDRDQRMMETLYDKDGNVIVKREVPRQDWEGYSQKNFAEATQYNEGEFRNTLADGERATFDRMSEGEKLKFYQEKHGWKCTDKHHVEASIDNSDQIIDPETGRRTSAGEPNILKVKRGEGTLADAQGEALMYQEKVRDAVASEQPAESFAQAKKAVDTYDGLRDGYEAQNLYAGKVKPPMRETMDVIRRNADAAAQGDSAAIGRINETLQKNGFKDMNDFADKIGGHIESLKWSKPQGG